MKVKDKKKISKQEYKKQFKDYDFNDDAKEVALDMADIVPTAEREDDEQSGWSGDLQVDAPKDEDVASDMSLEEEEGEAEVSESQKSDSDSDIEDDINSINSNDIKVDF